MWTKRKDETQEPPGSAPAGSSTAAREGFVVSNIPSGRTDAEAGRGGGASIGKSVVVKGQLFSREDLYIDGEMEGSVEMLEHRLTIGPNARLQAGIKAREVIILGTVHGNIDVTDRVDIRKNARLVGDIRTSRIMIEDGAYFKGSIDISKTEAPKAQPAPVVQTPPRPVSAVPATTVATAPVGGSTDARR